MRSLKEGLVGLFLLSGSVAALVLAAVLIMQARADRAGAEGAGGRAQERVFTVAVQETTAATIAPKMRAFGDIQSRRALDIRAPSAGRIVAAHPQFANGGRVKAGEVIAEIDPQDAQDALGRVGADLADAEAEVRDADRALILAQDELSAAQDQEALRRQALDRQKDLQGRGVGTTATVENAELAYASARQATLARRQALANAQARVDSAATRLIRAKLQFTDAERTLKDTRITAEFDGTLDGVAVVLGGLVAPNERLGRLVDDQKLEVAVRLSAAQYARLLRENGTLGAAPVEVALQSGDREIRAEGVIQRESASVGEGQTGRLVYAALEDARGLKPGDFVSVTIREPALEYVARVPALAIGARGDVLVVDADYRLREVLVEVLRREGNDVIVAAPAVDGQRIVTRRTPLLGAGIKVQIAGEAPKPVEMIALEDDRRARLIAFVKNNTRMPAERRDKMLKTLEQPEVPADVIARLEERMGS